MGAHPEPVPPCAFCQRPGTVQFPGVPGVFCTVCAAKVKDHLGASEGTWPELVAALIED